MLLSATPVTAGEGRISRAFNVRADLDTVTQWLLANQSAIAQSAKYTIISRQSGQGYEMVRMLRRTLKGDFDVTMREVIGEAPNEVNYMCELAQCHHGGVVKAMTRARLTRAGFGTKVEIWCETVVNASRIRNIDVTTSLSASARGFERMMKEKFGSG